MLDAAGITRGIVMATTIINSVDVTQYVKSHKITTPSCEQMYVEGEYATHTFPTTQYYKLRLDMEDAHKPCSREKNCWVVLFEQLMKDVIFIEMFSPTGTMKSDAVLCGFDWHEEWRDGSVPSGKTNAHGVRLFCPRIITWHEGYVEFKLISTTITSTKK
jgi:hypothetical protein